MIIVSSKGFAGEESCAKLTEVLGGDLSVLKVLFVPSAISLPTRRGKFFSMMTKRGFSRENVTVFDHTEPEKYTDLDIDLIYICGGNTFLLLERMRESGFGEQIKKYIDRGVTYVGASAGVHLLEPDVEHLLPFDENITGTTDFTALGLLDTIYYCHFCPEREPYYEAAVAEGKYKVSKLYDTDIEIVNEN